MQFNQFLDLQHLSTIPVIAFFVFTFVSYTKSQLDKLYKVSTDLYALVVGILFMGLILYAQGDKLSASWVVQSIVNGLAAAYVAGHMNDKALTSSISLPTTKTSSKDNTNQAAGS